MAGHLLVAEVDEADEMDFIFGMRLSLYIFWRKIIFIAKSSRSHNNNNNNLKHHAKVIMTGSGWAQPKRI